MYHGMELQHTINKLHKLELTTVDHDKKLNFANLLIKDKSISVQNKTLHYPVTKIVMTKQWLPNFIKFYNYCNAFAALATAQTFFNFISNIQFHFFHFCFRLT